MLDFFVDDGINPGYWSEKLEAESRYGNGYEEFSFDKHKQNVEEVFQGWVDSLDAEDDNDELIDEWRERVEDHWLDIEEDEHGAAQAHRTWQQSDEGPNFNDFWESSDRAYTYHYLWCCYALNWACKKVIEAEKARDLEAEQNVTGEKNG